MAKRLALISFLMLLVFPLSAAAEPRQVLLLHSFEREFAPFDAFTGNFRTELSKNSAVPVIFYEVSLQLARSNENPPEGPILDYMHAMLANQRLDLVVPIGGPAVRFAQKNRQQLFPATPMLLTAVDQRHLDMAAVKPNDAIVGVMSDTVLIVDTILRILPKTANIFVVIGNSQLETSWRDENAREFHRFKDRLKFVFLNELSFEEILKRSAELPPNSAIYYQLLAVDAKGVSHAEARVLRELHAVANAPIFGHQGYQLGEGIVGGPLLAIDELSRSAAGVALRIMDGESPEHLRLAPQLPGPSIFDERELRRWGISEDRLPPGSIVRFRELTVWEQYKWQIIAVLSVCLLEALLILALIVNLIKRRRAERSLGESRNRLGSILGMASEGILTFNDRGTIESVNAAAQNIFGYTADEMLGRNVGMILPAPFGPVREESVNNGQPISPDIKGAVREASGHRKDGSMFAIDLAMSEIILADRRIFTVFVRDITERKQVEQMQREFGKRLLLAQEAERAYFARELHDDISQQMVVLQFDLQRLKDRLGVEALRENDSLIVGASRRAATVIKNLRDLSHRLHPTHLRLVGLTGALMELQRELSTSDLLIDFSHENVPDPLSQDVILCFYRVVQEALNNAVKHSRAGRVSVQVRGSPYGIMMTIDDNGVGFDVGATQRGLGLLSIRERVEQIGGSLLLHSGPGKGTVLEVNVPYAQGEAVEAELFDGQSAGGHANPSITVRKRN